MVEVSVWGPLVYAGIFAATLSTALGLLIGAPRILVATLKVTGNAHYWLFFFVS